MGGWRGGGVGRGIGRLEGLVTVERGALNFVQHDIQV